MQSIKLSVCIPVYNNIRLFKCCLESIIQAIKGIEDKVEIVISDNASEDNIFTCYEKLKNQHENVNFIFSRSSENKGMAYNFHKVVELSNGEFCWIIGSDDFVAKDGVKKILHVLENCNKIDFISVAFSHIDLLQYSKNNENSEFICKNIKSEIENVSSRTINAKSKHTDGYKIWDELVDPSYNNVMLGSMMTGVFRRQLWLSVDVQGMDKNSQFSNIENTYPHCAVYARSMIGKPAYYISTPVIIVGAGARPWVGSNWWNGSLPVIYFKIWNEIINEYKKGGLKRFQVFKCRLEIAKTIGRFFYPYFYLKYISNQKIKNSDIISLKKAFLNVWFAPTFYIGLLKGVIKIHFYKIKE
ncbi:MAG: hypothetical protein A2275_07390 [Bacteroidetes bacterium RIFOXYA12_FULL_35_11]|nr:MAG: hypothetical protein A2X01_06480 [Bacteroidetes bacterium GWF2_35_48]OFY73071.1 MAG: hypothetical protein A2275_07390 [Bacteroidetes bacterium RIFOXYA12_FULL_35_11]OFY94627.1 MAG: hypothetical protein A2491_08930 [Bacteroidetes bacterium RIFOXYC12_FULL_35_7]OFY97431.1 MAG: hypothetical protein A2309_04055 [Bacteroidetes bacterium RIFOXYB2_FULL_35_7]HBX53530.1 hypothetical protein [Bacteroidales bacterium]